MRDEGEAYKGGDFEEVMGAYDEIEQTSSRDIIPFIVVLPEFGKEVVVIKVARKPDEREQDAKILEVD